MSGCLYYAVGAGLGHLTRGLKVCKTMDANRPQQILCYNAHLDEKRIGEMEHQWQVKIFSPNLETFEDPVGLRSWLNQKLNELNPERVYVDSFPVGLRGELAELNEVLSSNQLIYVARILNWQRYDEDHSPSINFDRSLIIEDLSPDHRSWLDTHGGEIVEFEISDMGISRSEGKLEQSCLVIHSGPQKEVELLLDYAREKLKSMKCSHYQIFLATMTRPENIRDGEVLIQEFPLRRSFDDFDCIVSAAGFNTIHDTHAFRGKRFILPFERRYDDQFRRKSLAMGPDQT